MEGIYIHGARNCKNRSKPTEDYGMLGDMMHEIAGMEEQRLQEN